VPRARPALPHPSINPPIVVLDAGHGGRDPGAEGVGGVLEKDVVLEVTRRLAMRLPERLPVTVLLTRSDDSFLSIDQRLAAAPDGAILFLSVHANACNDPAARGLEVFYGGGSLRTVGGRSTSPSAALLGRCLNHALRDRVGPVRGQARPGDFGVLVRNPLPSALVEIGYLTHPLEAARTQEAPYQELLVDALADGVAEYLRNSMPPL
jgi:N-acetylmuramoyl-L-alanine amidase